MEMFETTIQLKPRGQWRAGMTPEKLVEELDAAVKVPGLASIWIPPLRNRIVWTTPSAKALSCACGSRR